MTRAEAIALANAAMYAPDGVTWASSIEDADKQIAENRRTAERFVDAAVALGLLKLEASETAALAESLGWPVGGRSHQELVKALDGAGLRLVKKP